MDWTAVGVMRGRELCNIYYKKPGKCTWKIRSRSGRSQEKVREFFLSKSVGTLNLHITIFDAVFQTWPGVNDLVPRLPYS